MVPTQFYIIYIMTSHEHAPHTHEHCIPATPKTFQNIYGDQEHERYRTLPRCRMQTQPSRGGCSRAARIWKGVTWWAVDRLAVDRSLPGDPRGLKLPVEHVKGLAWRQDAEDRLARTKARNAARSDGKQLVKVIVVTLTEFRREQFSAT